MTKKELGSVWGLVESDHFPIYLEIAKVGKKPPNPFKFNPDWLEKDDFIILIKDHWVPYDGS